MPCQRDFINAVEFFQMRADFRCQNRKGGEPAVAGNFAGDPLGNLAFRFRFRNQRKIRMRMGVNKSGGENQSVGIDEPGVFPVQRSTGDRSYPLVFNQYPAGESRRAGTVDDGSITNQNF